MLNNLQQAVILILLSFLLISCGDNESKKQKSKKEIYITTSKVILKEFEDRETAIGSIEGIIDPTISAEITGKVIKLHTKPGSLVNKGDLLAEIETKDYKYQLSLAKAEVRRLETRPVSYTHLTLPTRAVV